MSILIKALKQAEREHMARTAAGVPAPSSATPDQAGPEPAPALPPALAARNGEALSLAPVEPNEPAAPDGDGPAGGQSTYEIEAGERRDGQDVNLADAPATHGQPPAFGDLPLAVALELAKPPSSSGTAVHPAMPPARSGSGSARSLAAVLQATEQGIAAEQAPAGTAPAIPGPVTPLAAAAKGPRTAGAPRAPAMQDAAIPPAPEQSPIAAVPLAEDPQSEERRTARQLMAAAPQGARNRRIAILLGAVVLLAGVLGAAYWQGLFADLDMLLQDAMAPAPTRTLAERFQSQPSAAADKPARPHVRAAAAATAAASGHQEAGTAAGSAAGGARSAAAAPIAGRAVAAQDARPGDGIHLRPPEAAPERIRALLQDAYVAAGSGDGARASRLYQQVVELDSNNGDAWIGLASLAANSGDSAGATRAYRRALEIDPGDGIALGGLLGLQSGVDAQEAESRLRLLIVHDGAQPALLAALGKMLARQGRWLEAQETFFKALAADPSQPDVAFNLAVSLERIRQPLPALSFYQRALELAHGHSARFDPAVAQERVAALTPQRP